MIMVLIVDFYNIPVSRHESLPHGGHLSLMVYPPSWFRTSITPLYHVMNPSLMVDTSPSWSIFLHGLGPL